MEAKEELVSRQKQRSTDLDNEGELAAENCCAGDSPDGEPCCEDCETDPCCDPNASKEENAKKTGCC